MKFAIVLVLCVASVYTQQVWDNQKMTNWQYTQSNPHYAMQTNGAIPTEMSMSETAALPQPTLSETLITGLVWSVKAAGQPALIAMMTGQFGKVIAKLVSFLLHIMEKIYGVLELPANIIAKVLNPFGTRT